MEIVIQKLNQLRSSLESDLTPSGNVTPILVDVRLLAPSYSEEFSLRLAQESEYVALPYGHHHDLVVFTNSVYRQLRHGCCDDDVVLAVFENIRPDFDLTRMDKILCLEL